MCLGRFVCASIKGRTDDPCASTRTIQLYVAPIKDPLRKRQPLCKELSSKHLSRRTNTFWASEKRTTSLQKTTSPAPKCLLFRGFTVLGVHGVHIFGVSQRWLESEGMTWIRGCGFSHRVWPEYSEGVYMCFFSSEKCCWGAGEFPHQEGEAHARTEDHWQSHWAEALLPIPVEKEQAALWAEGYRQGNREEVKETQPLNFLRKSIHIILYHNFFPIALFFVNSLMNCFLVA